MGDEKAETEHFGQLKQHIRIIGNWLNYQIIYPNSPIIYSVKNKKDSWRTNQDIISCNTTVSPEAIAA